MTLIIALAVVTVLVIAAADVLAPAIRTAAPIVLVLLGIGASFIPGMPVIELEPDVVLELILPPLLYGAAVAMPSMSFRRDFPAISWMAVPLVVISALVLGLLFELLVPDLGFLWGVALGAIISPTDAVATSIIKGRGVPGRVVTILEGESLLNDASALVILRTATVATVAGFSLWGAVGSFVYSVVVALVIGALVGIGNFWVRRRISSATVNTILSFTLPFIASIPTEMLGASGLVAAVVAGLITGFRGPRMLPAQHRMTSGVTWASIQMILEGSVFLTMGLQVKSAIERLQQDSLGFWAGIGIAALALVVTILVRSASLVPQLWFIDRRARRGQDMKPRIDAMEKRIDLSRLLTAQHAEAVEKAKSSAEGTPTKEQMIAAYRDALKEMADNGDELARRRLELGAAKRDKKFGLSMPGSHRAYEPSAGVDGGQPGGALAELARRSWDRSEDRKDMAQQLERRADRAAAEGLIGPAGSRPRQMPDPERLEQFETRLRRASAKISFLVSQPLGPREGAVLVWAGMRGAVTVAAAQTLPPETPHRALLLFVAYAVATMSLVIQGGTIGLLVGKLFPPERAQADREHMHDESDAITSLLQAAAAGAEADLPDDEPERAKRLAIIGAQRDTLLDARDDGLFDPEPLEDALLALDAEEIGLEMRPGD